MILIFTQGCILLNPKYASKDEEGYYTYHYVSCGPKALKKALKALGKDIDTDSVSRRIQSTGNIKRNIISFIHYDALQITWPSEIKQIAKEHGYNLKQLNNLSELKSGDVSIVLILGNLSEMDFHWMSTPSDPLEIIKNYFGKNTKILKIYKFTPAK